MKQLTLLLTLVFGLILSFNSSAKTSRIILITGGHDFERAPFFEMFDSFQGVSYTELKHPGALLQLGKMDPKTYDAVVFYDMPKSISEKEKETYHQLLKMGKGLLFMHHSLASYQEWEEYKTIVGGKYHEERDSPASSTYKHDVNFKVRIKDSQSPITKGISDFSILDEVYGNTEVLPGVKILLTTDHPESSHVIGWTHSKEKSHIVYIQPGHDQHSYTNESYRQMIRQAIEYVSGK